MKKYFFILTLSLIVMFEFAQSAKAEAIKIDVDQVIKWSSQKGLQKNLAMGDTKNDVKLLQYALTSTVLGFGSKDITGKFDKRTSQAISGFQYINGFDINGALDNTTREEINKVYLQALCPVGEGNAFPDEVMIHLNKTLSLPDDYIPSDLINISERIKTIGIVCIKKEVEQYLQQMFDDAKSHNINLVVTSGFRRPEVQASVYKFFKSQMGEQVKYRVAEPLHSEHQLGTAVDISSRSIDLEGTYGPIIEEAWLRKNAYKYGFVMSYPKDKILITGYQYEPWHYRYIGVEAAKEIFDKKISVEEYFNSIE